MSIIPALILASGTPMSLSVEPPIAYGSRTGAGTVTSYVVTVTVMGGTGAKTYSWVKLSGDVISATASTSATTAFSASIGLNDELGATFRCTVTDAIGMTATIDVDVNLYENSFL